MNLQGNGKARTLLGIILGAILGFLGNVAVNAWRDRVSIENTTTTVSVTTQTNKQEIDRLRTNVEGLTKVVAASREEIAAATEWRKAVDKRLSDIESAIRELPKHLR